MPGAVLGSNRRNDMTNLKTTIVGQFSALNDTDAGRAACLEYDTAVAAGASSDQAEVQASNVLQRAGFDVNRHGGASFETSATDDGAADDVTHMVSERLGDVATKQDAELVIAFAIAIWQEQIDSGLGDANEWATRAHVMNWLENRTYDWTRLYEAASGDVAAIAEVRAEAGLPALS
jgi:hypothetical protein